MKLRCKKPNGYRGAVACAFGQIIEVEGGLAATLLARPDWFEQVGGQDAGEAVAEAPTTSEKSLPAAPRKKPYRGKGK